MTILKITQEYIETMIECVWGPVHTLSVPNVTSSYHGVTNVSLLHYFVYSYAARHFGHGYLQKTILVRNWIHNSCSTSYTHWVKGNLSNIVCCWFKIIFFNLNFKGAIVPSELPELNRYHFAFFQLVHFIWGNIKKYCWILLNINISNIARWYLWCKMHQEQEEWKQNEVCWIQDVQIR